MFQHILKKETNVKNILYFILLCDAIRTYVFTILPFTCFTYALQITKNNKNTDFYIYCKFDRAIHFPCKTKKW